ncbi:hypothetical protein ACH6EH_07135 [Paenibacillus sp. JSM ZJ436]|uniref:hypothetical protein n=1 Tax=Paenibacillus sp. JSM ZJ436 TaxID=3376190 RepID=UPI0037AB63AA
MKNKISVTVKEFQELQRLADIVNDRCEPSYIRRMAKVQYEAILRLAKYRAGDI